VVRYRSRTDPCRSSRIAGVPSSNAVWLILTNHVGAIKVQISSTTGNIDVSLNSFSMTGPIPTALISEPASSSVIAGGLVGLLVVARAVCLGLRGINKGHTGSTFFCSVNVPSFVPTPCIEALRSVAHSRSARSCKMRKLRGFIDNEQSVSLN
jgi:hypothetical protein